MLLFLGREFLAELERLGHPLELNPKSLIFFGIFGVVFAVGWVSSASGCTRPSGHGSAPVRRRPRSPRPPSGFSPSSRR